LPFTRLPRKGPPEPATSKVVRGSEPFGITVAPNGDPWFTMLSADKINSSDYLGKSRRGCLLGN
jgi:streptogramin lyase